MPNDHSFTRVSNSNHPKFSLYPSFLSNPQPLYFSFLPSCACLSVVCESSKPRRTALSMLLLLSFALLTVRVSSVLFGCPAADPMFVARAATLSGRSFLLSSVARSTPWLSRCCW
ncbi:hypothetical protein BVRB_9g209810 [Beta vulgaris subsp. vulgaris]|nr:hypothetical protein BVRB_9g209810 [Beta vulgaris subsp. vulgaris]